MAFVLSFFGYAEVIVNKDTTIFSGLIVSAFTLAGLAIAAVAFSIKEKSDVARNLIGPTIAFLTSAFLLYANVVTSESLKFGYNYTSNPISAGYFSVNTILGMAGVIMYFLSISYLIVALVSIHRRLGVRSAPPKGKAEEQLPKDLTPVQTLTVRVKSQEGLGSGLLLNATGWVATCAHVVENSPSGEIETQFGTFKFVTVSKGSGDKDVALLKANLVHSPTD